MKAASRIATLLFVLGLASCASPPEYRMIPTADHGVGVRFSRGNAAMVSNGPSGSVMLIPVRYNDSDHRLYFSLAGFNTSGTPINFGTEDVRLYVDGANPVRVQDFNYLRQDSIRSARRAVAAAWLDAGLEYAISYRETEGLSDPYRHRIAYRRASGELAVSMQEIDHRLRYALRALGREVLQTTTIDPGGTTGGFVFADPLLIPSQTARNLLVEVNFGGYLHRFAINLAASDSTAEVPRNIPAVAAQPMQTLQRTPETWHWTSGPPASRADGVRIVE